MDVITYTADVNLLRTWAVHQYKLGNWHQYLSYNSETDTLYLLMSKVPTYYGIPLNTVSLCKLPIADVWELDDKGSSPTDVPGGFIGASMGLMQCIGEGVNRDPENDPFLNCWADPVNEAKYLLAFPRKPILDEEMNETGEYHPIAKFCEFDG